MVEPKEAYYIRLAEQTDIRVNELMSLRDDLVDLDKKKEYKNLRDWILGAETPNIKIDMDELIVVGHSFGGTSAMEFAAKLGKDRCKGALLYDAWLLPHA